jgi:general secretion pathway protein D
VALVGCAGEFAHREGMSLLGEGRPEEALTKLEQATKEAPGNSEFRLRYLSTRENVINSFLSGAQKELKAGRLDEAAVLYQRVLKTDPGNAQAAAGLGAVDQSRRHAKWLDEAGTHVSAGRLEAAESRLARIFQENPQHAEARQLQRQIEEKAGRGQVMPPRLRQVFKRPVSLEFRDANLKQVVEALSRHSGINFVLDREVPPNTSATLFLRQVSVEDALDVLLSTYQLEKRILNDNSVLIYPNTASKQSEHQDLAVKAFYLANADAKQVMNMLKTVLKVKNVYVDERLNLLMMRDTPAAIRLAERLVAMQDVHEPEVMLEVEVLEVKRTRLMELGIRFPDKLTLSPLPSTGTTVTLADLRNLNSERTGATLTNAEVNLRREVGDTNILANPRIRARNREKALIKIGDRVPVITTTTTSTGFVAESVQYIDVGLKLEVEPTIYPDNEVAIKVGLEVSSVVKQLKSSTGSITYQIGGRNASTVLRLKDGETQVLGGLINDEDRRSANRLPGLGDIPILGRLFSSQLDDNQKTELVLSITPRLVRGIAPPEHVPSEFWSGTENNLRIKPLAIAGLAADDKGAGDSARTAGSRLLQDVTTSTGTPVVLRWVGEPQGKVGDTLSVVLGISSPDALFGLPLQIQYDPAVLEAVDAQAGPFMAQGGNEVGFGKRIVKGSGMLFLTQTRTGSGGARGEGELVTLSFKALKPAVRSIVTALPATPIGEDRKPMRSTSSALVGISVKP